jgi:hypothetical protein
MEKISWVDRVRNEVLARVKEERNIRQTVKGSKDNWFGHCCFGTAFYNRLLKER